MATKKINKDKNIEILEIVKEIKNQLEYNTKLANKLSNLLKGKFIKTPSSDPYYEIIEEISYTDNTFLLYTEDGQFDLDDPFFNFKDLK